MKNLNLLVIVLFSLVMTSCGDDDNSKEIVANAGQNLTVDLEKTVLLDGTGSTGESLSYNWTLTDPNGDLSDLTKATDANPSFIASIEGTYMVGLTVTDAKGKTASNDIAVSVINPTYELEDQMGRPAINTVFNFFGDAMAKNGYNQTLPSEGSANINDFQGIFDALQGYIGLDPDTYKNVLELDNATTASVLATDVLGSNKNASSTYGPSDLNNIVVGQNVLNGRALTDDVIDVTLILAFAGNDLNNLTNLQAGLIGDNVSSNDKDFSGKFPYLADPH